MSFNSDLASSSIRKASEKNPVSLEGNMGDASLFRKQREDGDITHLLHLHLKRVD